MNQLTTERAAPVWQRQLFAFAFAAFAAVVFCYFIGLFVYAPLNNDQSWLLYAAQRVLAGAHISGPQLVETNPPLIIWFSVVPAFLASLLRIDAYTMLKVILFLMTLGSVAWCARILRISGVARSRAHLLLGTASVLAAEVFMIGFVVGQREHLLILLILPYILCAVLSEPCRASFSESCALGIAAGLAVSFKPQQLLILAGVELFLALQRRSLRRILSPDFLCAVLAVASYIGVVAIAVPRYFTATAPLLRETYWALGIYSPWHLIQREPVFNSLFAATLVVFIFTWKRLRLPVMPAAFLVCSLAGTFAFYAQRTGGEYRAYPQEAFLLLAILWIVIGLLPENLLASWKLNTAFAVTTAIIFLLAMPASIAVGNALDRYEPPNWHAANTVFSIYPPHTPVFLFSTTPDAFPAISRSHLVWASRFVHLWMLPAIIQNEAFEAGGPTPRKLLSPTMVRSLAALQRTDTAEDFHRWKPVVVVVPRCNQKNACWGIDNPNFNYLAWFLQSPAFAAEWSHYQLQSTNSEATVYTRDSGAPVTVAHLN